MKRLVYLILFITDECNAGCPFCCARNLKKETIFGPDLHDLQKLAHSMPRLLQLTLTGGEPYLRSDLDKIVRIFSRRGVRRISIPSNGTRSEIVLPMIEKILSENPKTEFRFIFSLQGWEKEQDRIMAVPGAFDSLKKILEQLVLWKKGKNAGRFRVDLTTVAHQGNKEKIKEIFQMAAQNLPFDDHVLLLGRSPWGEKRDFELTSAEYEKLRAEYNRQYPPKSNSFYNLFQEQIFREAQKEISKSLKKGENTFGSCQAGKRLLVIRADGGVFPCEPLELSLGRLPDFDWDLKMLLASFAAQKAQKELEDLSCFCSWECAALCNALFSPSLLAGTFSRVLSGPGKTLVED